MTHRRLLHPLVALSFFIALFSGLAVKSQAAEGIGVSLLSYTLDSSNDVNLGYTITINAEVTNFDTATYTGVVYFGLRNNHGVISNPNIFNQPPYSGSLITLHGGEIVPAVFSVNVNPQYFTPGPDVVVVWPLCTAPSGDSIVIYLNVHDPLATDDKTNEGFSYAVLHDKILLLNGSTANNFKQVRIFNIMGQLMAHTESGNITQIQLPDMPHGIYLCELLTEQKRRTVIKFFH